MRKYFKEKLEEKDLLVKTSDRIRTVLTALGIVEGLTENEHKEFNHYHTNL